MDANLQLDLTRFQTEIQVKHDAGKRWIWDAIRLKWLVLQPEELVRQLLIQYLILELGVNKNRISIERGLKVVKRQKRSDILIYGPDMNPWLLVECKAPSVKLKEAVFHQISIYNRQLQVPYLLVCNGPEAYCCQIDLTKEAFDFLPSIPPYPTNDETEV